MENRKYPIELEVITPLSVGAGNDNEWVKGLDFIQKEGMVYVIDMQKAATAGVDVEAITALFLKSDERGISQMLGNKIEELSRYVFDLPAKTDNNIKTFLRTQFYDKPLVAGSSIKGSVRSALFNYLRTDEEKNEEVFGTMKDGTDFMRFVRIGDVEMPSTVLVNTKLFNLRKEGAEWFGGWKHQMNKTTRDYDSVGFNTLYESVAPGQKGLGNISLAANAFSLLEKYGRIRSPYASKKQTLLNEPISHLFQVINDVTKVYLQKEHAFFEKYRAERSDEVLENIDTLLAMIPTDGSSCLLKMSAGVGFHSITGDWRFEDFDKTPYEAGKKKYKSRKIAEYNQRLQLMGFVRLRVLNVNEAFEIERSLQSSHKDLENQILFSINQRKAEQERRIAEKQAQIQRSEEEQRNQTNFRLLIEQAQIASNEEMWDEAISKSEEALRIYPENVEAAKLLKIYKNSQIAVEYRQQEKEASLQRMSLPLVEVLRGKTSAGNLVGTLIKWLKVEERSFSDAEYSVLLNEVKKLPNKEQKKLKGKKKELQNAIGEDKTSQLFNDLSLS